MSEIPADAVDVYRVPLGWRFDRDADVWINPWDGNKFRHLPTFYPHVLLTDTVAIPARRPYKAA